MRQTHISWPFKASILLVFSPSWIAFSSYSTDPMSQVFKHWFFIKLYFGTVEWRFYNMEVNICQFFYIFTRDEILLHHLLFKYIPSYHTIKSLTFLHRPGSIDWSLKTKAARIFTTNKSHRNKRWTQSGQFLRVTQRMNQLLKTDNLD